MRRPKVTAGRPRARSGLSVGLVFVAGLAALLALTGSSLGARELTTTVEALGSAFDNTTVVFNVSVNNSGDANAPSVDVQLYLEGAPMGALINFGPVSAGEVTSLNVSHSIACGNRVVNATVDPANSIVEGDETNNNFTLPLRVFPFVNFTTSLSGPLGALNLTLDASASHGCEPLSFTWNAEGITKNGSVVSYTPPSGNLTVGLTVTPGDTTLAVSRSFTVSIPNLAPTVAATIPVPSIMTNVSLALSVAAGDEDGFVDVYLITFGDGSSTTSLLEGASHKYVRAGQYTINLRVTDNLGATNETNVSVTVTNRAPVVVTNFPYWITEAGKAVRFNASGSTDQEGTALTVVWDFGDGVNATGPDVSHTYAAAGVYHATVTVTDADGGQTTKTIDVTVLAPSDATPLIIGGVIAAAAALLLLLLLLKRRKRGEEPPQKPAGEGEGISGKPPSL